MNEKIAESLKNNKEQLDQLTKSKADLENQLNQTIQAILQLQGAIAALEYVIGLEAPTKDGEVVEG